jgi:hypothetical protein
MTIYDDGSQQCSTGVLYCGDVGWPASVDYWASFLTKPTILLHLIYIDTLAIETEFSKFNALQDQSSSSIIVCCLRRITLNHLYVNIFRGIC